MQGSVSVSMSVFQSRMCFVCSHLASGQKDGAEQRQNSDVHEILRRTLVNINSTYLGFVSSLTWFPLHLSWPLSILTPLVQKLHPS
jgi:hypothetical protein